MSRSTEILVSRVTVNDDTVKVHTWHIAPGDHVRRGTLLYTLETSKASFDVEAEADGFLEIVAPVGTQVPVGAAVGRLWDEPPQDVRIAKPVAEARNAGQVFTQRARELAEQHGLSHDAFAGLAMVRESDVLSALRSRDTNGAASDSTAPTAPRAASQPVLEAPRAGHGVKTDSLREARAAAAARGRSIVWLAVHYLLRTWLLTNFVRWAPRGLLIPVHRLRGVRIGKNCFIDPAAIIETAHASNITIGDDVRIAAGAVIMTHIKPPYYLSDNGFVEPVVKPVHIEDHCFIGVNAVVMPGVRIGRAAVVASGAVVLGDVPPMTMVAGNPAQVVKHFTLPR